MKIGMVTKRKKKTQFRCNIFDKHILKRVHTYNLLLQKLRAFVSKFSN